MKYIKNPDFNPRHYALWILNGKGIVKSIENVFNSGNIDKLAKDSYNFVMSLSGFIAHYDINGFKNNYVNVRDFLEDLDKSADIRNPKRYIEDKYFSDNEQRVYYAQKAKVLKEIAILCNRYKDRIEEMETKSIERKMNALFEKVSEIKDNPIQSKKFLKSINLL